MSEAKLKTDANVTCLYILPQLVLSNKIAFSQLKIEQPGKCV